VTLEIIGRKNCNVLRCAKKLKSIRTKKKKKEKKKKVVKRETEKKKKSSQKFMRGDNITFQPSLSPY